VLREDGAVLYWVTLQASPPIVVASNAVAIALDRSDNNSFAVLKADGTVWERDLSGVGVSQVGSLSNIVAISVDDSENLALRADGTVMPWSGMGAYWFVPGQPNAVVPPEATNVIAISAGWLHCMALRSDGTVISWGPRIGTNIFATNAVAIACGNPDLALKATERWLVPLRM
jgi:hypothetical protein